VNVLRGSKMRIEKERERDAGYDRQKVDTLLINSYIPQFPPPSRHFNFRCSLA